MTMNILVAGATGKTGRQVLQALIDQGHKPTALVRESSDTSDLPHDVDLRNGDLTDLPSDVCDKISPLVLVEQLVPR